MFQVCASPSVPQEKSEVAQEQNERQFAPFFINVGNVIGLKGIVILLGRSTAELSSYRAPEHIMQCVRIQFSTSAFASAYAPRCLYESTDSADGRKQVFIPKQTLRL